MPTYEVTIRRTIHTIETATIAVSASNAGDAVEAAEHIDDEDLDWTFVDTRDPTYTYQSVENVS